MYKQQRHCIFDWTSLVHEVNVQLSESVDLNLSLELRESIELLLVFPPVILLAPILCQAFDVGQGCAVVPAGFIEFVGKCGEE